MSLFPDNGAKANRPDSSGSRFKSQSPLSEIFKGVGQTLQGLATMLGSSKGPGHHGHVGDSPSRIEGSGRIWGDPHFIGADGGKFDVQGKAGKTYNLLSDQGFQMNGRFDKWGDKGATAVGKVGITAGSNYVSVDKSGAASVNGQALKDGERVSLRGGGYAERKGNDITVKKGEWQVDFQAKGSHLDMDVKTKNAIADGVKPHGLLGQTFDGDGIARNGDKGKGAQGGGAIEHADGTMSGKGDKDAVKGYEVDNLWDTHFGSHNADFGQHGNYANHMMNEMMQFATMMAFGNLINSMLMSGSIFDSQQYG
ncbi:hypothetical protein [Paracoccus sp. (in: a-proteobacteria)]|uniref:hypothetical protein n=1 Tax=Paracoccus sp. TaxID=267 RepID=UPI003A8B649D